MTALPFHAAVDLGAGSGRVFVGAVAAGALRLHEAHRFQYAPRFANGRLRWDVDRLDEGLLAGLRQAVAAARAHGGELVSIGVDSWGVDYGLVDEDGRLLEEPICYRDSRIDGVPDQIFLRVPRHEVFQATGIQVLHFNTLFQLAAHVRDGLPARAARLLLIPDLCHHRLCGSTTGERTNASTTQLVDVKTGDWHDSLFQRLGLPRGLMPDLVDPGTDLGSLRPELCAAAGTRGLRVVAPASHDTASAVAGTPLEAGWAYISSGTWSLVGVERAAPLVNEPALHANFTNERGVGGTIRFLKNVMGLWILDSCRNEWRAEGLPDALPALLRRVAEIQGVGGLIAPDDQRFFNPPSMVSEIRQALSGSGQPAASEPAVVAKVILDSLALRYAAVVSALETLTETSVPGIHVVGGGSLNDYLNQATANASGRPVRAGPVEAAAAGNVLVQAAAHGTIESVTDGRRVVAHTVAPRRFEPRDGEIWRKAAERYREIEAREAAWRARTA